MDMTPWMALFFLINRVAGDLLDFLNCDGV
jgi:hypothetical protein